MSFFAWVFVGIVSGWLAERISGRNHGLLTNLIVGVIGALIGGLLSGVIGFHYDRGVNLASIAVATAGAVLFLYVFGGIRDRRELR